MRALGMLRSACTVAQPAGGGGDPDRSTRAVAGGYHRRTARALAKAARRRLNNVWKGGSTENHGKSGEFAQSGEETPRLEVDAFRVRSHRASFRPASTGDC